MLTVKTDESFWTYSGQNNFLVIPITRYLRQDGYITLIDPIAKEAEQLHPPLRRIWGYLVDAGIKLPVYSRGIYNLVGAATRHHYASKPDQEIVIESLNLLVELADSNPEYLFYLNDYLGGFKELNEEILSDRFIVLEGK